MPVADHVLDSLTDWDQGAEKVIQEGKSLGDSKLVMCHSYSWNQLSGCKGWHQGVPGGRTGWTLRANVMTKPGVLIRPILNKRGYPPDKPEKATQTVLELAGVLPERWS